MYSILPLLGNGLIIIGAMLLALSIAPVWKLFRQLPTGRIQFGWGVLILLILFFIVGYVVYVTFSLVTYNQPLDLVVPTIFFCGAIFVFIVCTLSLKTTSDIMQLYTLKQENITDPLMGIFNRRYLERRLNDETKKAQIYSYPLSVFMIDIDHFKNINDTYGHQIGDLVLKNVANKIKESLRESDVLARYGGEEFVVILPKTKVDTSYALAERLRLVVEDSIHSFTADSGVDLVSIRVTVSVGVAGLTSSCHGAQCLIKNADKALYQAKQSGRNQVMMSGKLMEAIPSKECYTGKSCRS